MLMSRTLTANQQLTRHNVNMTVLRLLSPPHESTEEEFLEKLKSIPGYYESPSGLYFERRDGMLLCIKSWRDQRNYHIHPRKLYRKRSLAKYDKQTRRLFMKVREEREKDFLDKQRWEEEEMLKDTARRRRRRRRAVSYFPDKQRWEEMFKVAATRRRRRAVSY